jgi:hypothetical protein
MLFKLAGLHFLNVTALATDIIVEQMCNCLVGVTKRMLNADP